jgi:hypothetical protein
MHNLTTEKLCLAGSTPRETEFFLSPDLPDFPEPPAITL